MKHLSSSELVDYAEGVLDTARVRHLDACASCRATAGDARATLQRAREVSDVPEPSPLFWDHLSTRIREQVANKRPARPWNVGWLGQRGFVPVAAAVMMVALVSAAITLRRVPPPVATSAPAASAPAIVEYEPAVGTIFDEHTNEVWQVLTAVVSDVQWEDVHAEGMAVPTAAVERAVQRLSPVELGELERLLHSEMRRAGD